MSYNECQSTGRLLLWQEGKIWRLILDCSSISARAVVVLTGRGVARAAARSAAAHGAARATAHWPARATHDDGNYLLYVSVDTVIRGLSLARPARTPTLASFMWYVFKTPLVYIYHSVEPREN